MKALTIIRTANVQQESYESATRFARKRAIQLRKLGYSVVVSSMGFQVTPVGLARLSLVTILNPDNNIPKIEEYKFI